MTDPTRYTLPAIGKPPLGPPLRKVAIEEHFNYLSASPGSSASDITGMLKAMDYDDTWSGLVGERLADVDALRLAAMDEGGIDISILSHTIPGVQGILDPADAVVAAREVNDFLAETVRRHPTRFAGFASLPLQDPAAAAVELERCVRRLGFKGAMVNGYADVAGPARAAYLDEPQYLPFWDAVAALGVPIYLHPRPPVEQRAYDGHAELLGATWGFAPETATHALRLVYSGLFDRLPNLTVILGHLGETLPFFAWRIQHCFEYNPSDKRLERRLQDYLCENFYVTTSGNFNDQALVTALLTVGADRILFAVDYPYELVSQATEWIERAPISENDRRKIAHLNSRALFSLSATR